jgi:hypothetical protein
MQVAAIAELQGTQAGDTVVMARSCEGIVSSPVAMPAGPSGKIVLAADGTTTLRSLAAGRLSELGEGRYSVCYATAASGADSDHDFSPLLAGINVHVSLRHPGVSVPMVVQTGQEIAVQWTASNGMEERLSHQGDWVALYRRGECLARDQDWRHPYDAPGHSTGPVSDQNMCYLQAIRLPAGQGGGEVRFKAADYQARGGEYDVRFFEGDSRHGDGLVCRGRRGIKDESPPPLVCVLEAAVVSTPITVQNLLAAAGGAERVQYYESSPSAVPGLEMFCTGTAECGRIEATKHLDNRQYLV